MSTADLWAQPGRPPVRRRPPRSVTSTLVGANVAVFVLQTLVPALTGALALVPALVVRDEPYRVLTAAFLHGGLLHLALNMLALWTAGRSLEPVLGRARFALLYLGSALGGGVLSAALGPALTPSVGASGAVFGLFGALLVLSRWFGADVRSLATLVGTNLVFGFVVPGIDWRAHVGGLLAGAVVAALMAPTLRTPPRRLG